jgi:hypothetical protein
MTIVIITNTITTQILTQTQTQITMSMETITATINPHINLINTTIRITTILMTTQMKTTHPRNKLIMKKIQPTMNSRQSHINKRTPELIIIKINTPKINITTKVKTFQMTIIIKATTIITTRKTHLTTTTTTTKITTLDIKAIKMTIPATIHTITMKIITATNQNTIKSDPIIKKHTQNINHITTIKTISLRRERLN